MNLYDCHVHSTCSPDGSNTMAEMAHALYARGIKYVCFTDHCDLIVNMTGKRKENPFAHKEKTLQMFEETKNQIPKDMVIRLGMELGAGHHDENLAKEIASTAELDFVIGSVHNLKGEKDFYFLDYSSMEQCLAINEKYLDEILELSALDFYDVIAHLGYTVRYMSRDGFLPFIVYEEHREKIDGILKNLIDGGRGIEINTSGIIRDGLNMPNPHISILKRYLELGGEIITLGSDSHNAPNAGLGIKEGFDILKNLGYKYITVFENRKPIFNKI